MFDLSSRPAQQIDHPTEKWVGLTGIPLKGWMWVDGLNAVGCVALDDKEEQYVTVAVSCVGQLYIQTNSDQVCIHLYRPSLALVTALQLIQAFKGAM